VPELNDSAENHESVIYDFDPNNLPAEFLQAIGLTIATASQTEHVMRDFIGALLTIDNADTLALCTHLSAPLKDDIIRALAELKAPRASEVDAIDDMMDRIRDAMAKRNSIAHNAFAQHPKDGAILAMKETARGSLQVDLAPITAGELRAVAKEIYDAGMALQEFMMTRGLGPRFRTEPLREPLNRKQKARRKRQTDFGDRY
jgi:hypothetical protein